MDTNNWNSKSIHKKGHMMEISLDNNNNNSKSILLVLLYVCLHALCYTHKLDIKTCFGWFVVLLALPFLWEERDDDGRKVDNIIGISSCYEVFLCFWFDKRPFLSWTRILIKGFTKNRRRKERKGDVIICSSIKSKPKDVFVFKKSFEFVSHIMMPLCRLAPSIS